MYVVFVYVHVKPEDVGDFIEASLENARNTIQEPGNLRFDVNRRIDDPNRFVLYEVYRDAEGMEAHKRTDHYARWRDAVEPWMAEPRRAEKCDGLFPETGDGWATRF